MEKWKFEILPIKAVKSKYKINKEIIIYKLKYKWMMFVPKFILNIFKPSIKRNIDLKNIQLPQFKNNKIIQEITIKI